MNDLGPVGGPGELITHDSFWMTPSPITYTALYFRMLAGVESGELGAQHVAVTQRASSGAHKIIFWFAATAGSLAVPDADTQQEDEDFEVLWASFQESQDKLTFDDDKAVAAYVIDAITSALRDNNLLSIYPRPLPLSFMSIEDFSQPTSKPY
ncbi:hypothetical protein B0A48_18219 [Cryoendolithus antarcticus]|uniref:Uncharacterized protein n=1 Tax=Cryoendolithus antarcticus TaxID=1507870 RepID=A0A1V8S9M5_9PEZI|nr:hypothetical protein B0A48_18219 [Cryoendolithus antarcticus]